ncbi:hypothetical protein IBB3154_1052 [Ligilactobacillus salivarius]|nr:hypothetical protein [Ligilactobacillus salivarius]QIG36541.1 hypothetical protein IBB3154_1052 [Ligilactobacillus salivarius]
MAEKFFPVLPLNPEITFVSWPEIISLINSVLTVFLAIVFEIVKSQLLDESFL